MIWNVYNLEELEKSTIVAEKVTNRIQKSFSGNGIGNIEILILTDTFMTTETKFGDYCLGNSNFQITNSENIIWKRKR